MPVTKLTISTNDGRTFRLTGESLTVNDVLAKMAQLPATEDASNTPIDPRAPYKVGDLIHFQEGDPEFATRAEAEQYARKLYEIDSDPAYGIWDVDGLCVSIFYVGALYTP